MRARSLFAVCLFLVSPAALARDPMTKDGQFTICAFQNFDKCELLRARAIRKYRFGGEERRTLKKLQAYAAASPSPTQSELEKMFGKPSKIFPRTDRPTERTIAWFRNSVGLNDLTAKCPECGLYITLSGDLMTALTYIVDRKFTLVWYRRLAIARM